MHSEPLKCLYPTCINDGAYCRGLCQRHYTVVGRLVGLKKLTWDELEAKGMIAKSQGKGRSLMNQEARDYYLGIKSENKPGGGS